MKFGPGMFFGGSRTLSFCRAVVGTKAKGFDGWVRLAGGRGVLPIDRRPAHRTVTPERIHGRVCALVVSRQEVFASAVGGEIGWPVLGRDAPQRSQGTTGRVDAPALDPRRTAIADIQDVPVRADRED